MARLAWTLRVSLAAGALWLSPGCNSAAAQRARLASPYPPDRARAAVRLGEARDADAVAKLVDLLIDPDRAVRMYSILALERMCGQTYGYRYYDPAPQRAAAVERWRAALREGQVATRGSGPDGAAAAPAADVTAAGFGEGQAP